MKTHSPRSLPRTAWTDEETASLVRLYSRLLDLHDRGQLGPGKATTKAAAIRQWIADAAPGRSKGSVEAKLMNISASRVELGLPWLPGFKPMTNRSRGLDAIVKAISAAVLVLLAA